MKLMKTSALAVTFGLAMLCASEAAAQNAPTLTVTVNGPQVLINWTDVPGALGYRLKAGTTPGGSQVVSLLLPAGIGRPISANPVPVGTYYLRVSAVSLTGDGPDSAEVIATVAGAGCSTMTAPVLTSSVNGAAAAFNWGAVNGASAYTMQFSRTAGGTELAVPQPASSTAYTLTIPANLIPGTFFARLVAINSCGQQVVSNEVPFTIGSQCGTNNPVLSANVAGAIITFTWTGVSPTASVTIDYALTSGTYIAGAVVPAGGTSYSQRAPRTGTFFARMRVTGCGGNANSPEIAFTVTNLNLGSGPRSPDPAPGTRLPLPSYGRDVAIAMANTYRGDLNNSCGSHTWLFRLLRELRTRDSRWGLNWKRGFYGGMSDDIISFNGTANPDDMNPEAYIVDVIGGHCGPAPDWNWTDVTSATPRFDPGCAAAGCIAWTIDPYMNAGFPPDQKQ